METNFADESTQPVPDARVVSVLLFFGDRLAIILFFLFTCALLVSGNIIPQAFSKQEEPQMTRQNTNWYEENISFPIPIVEKSGTSFQISAVEVTPTPTPTPPPIDTSSNDVWLKLADCESHQNWSEDTGNGYFGGLQFNQTAWESTGGSGSPAAASMDEQITRGKILQSRRGWGPWGGCAKKLGLL